MTQIITDSMSDILPQEAQRLGVRVVVTGLSLIHI